MRDRRSDTPVYTISIAAELIGVHPRTLRIYEERGLVRPARRSNLRLYSDEDIRRVRLIRTLIEERGLNLAGVKLFLEIQMQHHEITYYVLDSAPDDEGEGRDRG